MEVVRPQFTFDTEEKLHIEVEISDDEYKSDQLQTLNKLDRMKGVEAVGVSQVTVDVRPAFADKSGFWNQEKVTTFLDSISRIIPYVPGDKRDRVAYPQHLWARGLSTGVYPSLQSWLNADDAMQEATAKDVMTAMALPFGKKYEQMVTNQYRQYTNGASSLVFSYGLSEEDFGLRRTVKTDEGHLEQNGSVNWRWLNLETLGSCACFGVNGDDRDRVNVSEDKHVPWLYEMHPHNIDVANQSLSLILGMGAVAFKAAAHETDDVLESATWNEGRFYPHQ